MAATEHRAILDEVYRAFNRGDVDRLKELFADDMTMVIPGATQISGTFRGRDEVFGAFAQMAAITGGTSHAAVERVLVDDTGGVVIAVDSARRDGEDVSARFADVYRIEQGRVTELRPFPEDPIAMNHFWRRGDRP
ncbi:nuclear transport factor 2 family protein [Oerskovia jenensis]|uniref:Ketosteroid isomerase-like protein n=1 Tax=Oerskovia jenensis TaxID=162169 RepID=A0ABS2LDN0_9CELL|nr:nuclear transport factor 2 family protein [Oerskovia jenensis]MBM7478516.1 ketosteroid isomerase-like protein [Oerskovia jenensis]